MKVLGSALIAVALAFTALFAQQPTRPARDVAPAALSGNASIWGRVTIDGAGNLPARGAIVTLNHTDHAYGDTAVTDADGQFEFKKIPAGRYLLAVEKEGYVTTRFGATKPGRAGTPLAITDGLHVDGMMLKIVRGSVLTGVVRDADGEPAQGVRVVVKRFANAGSARRLTDVYAGGDSTTDDRGVYRIYGLAAGEYVLQAIPIGHDHGGGSSSAHPTTAADVRWARAMLMTPAEVAARGTPPPPAGGSVGYAPVYYPNTLQQSAAAVITVGAGEERTGLDFLLSLLPTYRVSGVVTTPAGSALSQPPQVYLAELSGNGGDWYGIKETGGTTFSFEGVAPGRYAVAAIMEDTRMWAIANVTVGAQNETVALALQPGLSVSGQLVFQGTRPIPPDLTHVGLYWQAVAIAGGLAIEPPSSEANADGTFTVKGLVPGSYRMLASVMDGDQRAGEGWTLRSVMVGDRDIADVPLEVRAGTDIGKIVVTFTDRPTELSGRLQDASGRAASDYFIIVFSSDERTWSQNARRITQTRPASDGHFLVRGLPPGEYFLAALTDVERDEWYDAGFLRELIPAAAKITLGEGEKKVQDIRIAGIR